MLCKQILLTDYPTVSIASSTQELISAMEIAQVQTIPVLEDNKLVGMASKALLENQKPSSLSDLFSGLTPNSVAEDDHIFSALRLMSNSAINLVAVHNKQGEYSGVITAEVLISSVGTLLGMNEAPSGSITFDMDRNDYSFGELARLVETNDADIVQLNTYTEASTGLLVINMKVSKEDVSDIVATLQRYDYHIRYYFGKETYDNELKANYDALINYLNI